MRNFLYTNLRMESPMYVKKIDFYIVDSDVHNRFAYLYEQVYNYTNLSGVVAFFFVLLIPWIINESYLRPFTH